MFNMNKKALTLLEIIIATIILALVVTGLVNVFISGKRYIAHSRSKMAGGELGKYFIDPFQMQVNQSNWDNNCLSNSSLCASENRTINDIYYNATYNTSTVSVPNLRRIIVNITWNEPAP